MLIVSRVHRPGDEGVWRWYPTVANTFLALLFLPRPALQSLGDVGALLYRPFPKAPKGCLGQTTSWQGYFMAVSAMVFGTTMHKTGEVRNGVRSRKPDTPAQTGRPVMSRELRASRSESRHLVFNILYDPVKAG